MRELDFAPSRRAVLRTAALGTAAVALAGCDGMFNTPATGVTFTQAALADASNVIAGLNNLLGSLATVPAGVKTQAASAATRIATYIGDAESALSKISVGSLVSPTTVKGIFTDLEAAAGDVAAFLPGNPYLMAVQALLPILAAAWSLVAPASAVAGGMTADQARGLLGKLPRPVGLAK